MALALPFLRRRKRRPIPILSYHALHAPATDYASNDHVALEADLGLIRRLGFKVARLEDIARLTWSRRASPLDSGSWVGLSFDDGTDFDFFDIPAHPTLGYVKSFYTILREGAAADWPQPTGTSFVIASPEARAVLDRTCIAGLDQWRDVWWGDAARTGLLEIGNHSWDHTHPTLERIAQRDQRKGTFQGIDNRGDADAQIIQADRYIRRLTGGRAAPLFAYPYGDAPDYLVREYFPREMGRHGMLAAFSTSGDYATADSDRWNIPRFMCGAHWNHPQGLEAILRGA
ncbi:MAG TPA: polysaccharide deacetylase family protein [Casimicrobiaceae bacterium]|nr:polysaccharide deacetylase family protein [Casimicrobiaceae bacterium]